MLRREAGFSLGIFLAIIAVRLVPETAAAQDFRIETEVIDAVSGDVISENLTLFSGNLIIDFMLSPDTTRFPSEIVIYDTSLKRFVLMDTARKIRTEVADTDLLKILVALQGSHFVDETNEFLFRPEFEESYDQSTGQVELRCPRLTYRMKGTRPAQDVALHRYFEFIDQFARLNATDPRRMPPFARLKLNQAIKKHGVIAEEVEMCLSPDAEGERPEIRIRSKHVAMWKLSEQDRERIESARRYWMEFKNVGLKEYRDIEESVAALPAGEDGETKEDSPAPQNR
jgi:hypothetical protein